MIRISILFCCFIGVTNYSCQTNNCKFLREYCENENCDNIDSSSFCNGARLASNAIDFEIRLACDPSLVSRCLYYSYEKYGVKLVCIGDVLTKEEFSEAEGYSFVARKNIRKSLGKNYSELGNIDTAFFDIDIDFVKKLQGMISVAEIDKNVYKFSLGKESLEDGFNNVPFRFLTFNELYTVKDLYSGIIQEIPGDRAIINLDISEFDHPNFCKSDEGVTNFNVILPLP